ncbi:hypothetical protein NL676_021424 [Syzygium grande]|nr:hypothetical protein NL676_021424 [Syzygium grande]
MHEDQDLKAGVLSHCSDSWRPALLLSIYWGGQDLNAAVIAFKGSSWIYYACHNTTMRPGHSMGGPMASFCGLDIVVWLSNLQQIGSW